MWKSFFAQCRSIPFFCDLKAIDSLRLCRISRPSIFFINCRKGSLNFSWIAFPATIDSRPTIFQTSFLAFFENLFVPFGVYPKSVGMLPKPFGIYPGTIGPYPDIFGVYPGRNGILTCRFGMYPALFGIYPNGSRIYPNSLGMPRMAFGTLRYKGVQKQARRSKKNQ